MAQAQAQAQAEAQAQAQEHGKKGGLLVKQVFVQYGPYGSKLPRNYNWQLFHGDHISEVIINHGNIVDAIGFNIATPDGSTFVTKFGGNGGKQSIIKLKKNEYPIGFSGVHGYHSKSNDVVIGEIKIHTNLYVEGYGPYGFGMDIINVGKFVTAHEYGLPLIGIFGKHGNYLESIGVLLKFD